MKDIMKIIVFGGLFAVPFLTLYVESSMFFPFITGKNFWFRILVDVTVAAWVILALYDVQYRPRISGITWSFGILLIIMFFANLLGAHPQSSFWSNFERMDGYVSLVHTFLYMLVLGSVLQTKRQWNILLNVSLGVATLVALQGLHQFLGEESKRIDSSLGNAAYMAIYTLFHIFISFWLFVESKVTWQKVVYAALSILFIFILLQTGTRGTALGLAVGVFVMSAYIGLFGTQFKQYRKYAIGGFVLLLIAMSAFVMVRDTEFVQNSKSLKRIANISLSDLEIRGIIWGAAWEGVKEEPLLGYGQSNFNFVFNEYYDPRLYAQEQWFDRAHNIFMDWLIAGGFLGLIAYLSIFVWCAWYLFVRPLRNPEDESFNVLERGVLLGILAGYFTHNLVVFDNIVSYIFFAIILGLITARVGKIPQRIKDVRVDSLLINQFAAPVMLVGLVSAIYFVHVPGMQAAGDIIDAFQEQQPAERLAEFQEAIARDSFAHQEIVEQLAQQTMSVMRNEQVSDEVKQEFATYTEEQLLRLLEEKPGDARIHVFVGTYYRSMGQPDKAREQFARARELSPLKQAIIYQQGFAELAAGDYEASRDFLQTAYELEESNLEAKEYYAASLFYTNQTEEVLALVDDEATRAKFAASDFVLSAANDNGVTEFLIEMYEYRVNSASSGQQNWAEDPQMWASLAYLYYQVGNSELAVSTLNEAKEKIPAFAPSANCFIENIENGRAPQTECQ